MPLCLGGLHIDMIRAIQLPILKVRNEPSLLIHKSSFIKIKSLFYLKWMSPSLSELTLIISNMELTHFHSEVSKCGFGILKAICYENRSYIIYFDNSTWSFRKLCVAKQSQIKINFY